MKLFNPNIFNSAVFNTKIGVAKTLLFNRNVFGSPPLFNTGEEVTIIPEPEIVPNVDQLQTGGIPGPAYQLYKGKVYTIQEAARLRELDKQASVEQTPEIPVEEPQVIELTNIPDLAEAARKIADAKRDLQIIRDARREVEVEASLRRFEAEQLAAREEEAARVLVQLQEEEERLVVITLMMLV